MTYYKSLFSLSAALMITACGSIPEYTTTATEKTRLRVALIEGPVSNLPNDITGESVFVTIHEPGACGDGLEFGHLYVPNDKKQRAGELDMPLGAYSKSAVDEGYIEANKPMRVQVKFGILNGSPLFGKVERCDISLDTSFDPGVDYEFVTVMNSFETCSVDINKLVMVNGEPERQKIKTITEVDHPMPAQCLAEEDDKKDDGDK